MTRVWLVVGLIGVLGCGEDKKAPILVRHDDKHDPRDASFEEVDAAVSVDAGTAPAVGPVLEFLSPLPARNPSDDTVITDNEVTVRCKATQRPGSKEVNRSSIKISLDKNKEGTAVVTAPVEPLANDEYEAKFNVGMFENGVLRFHCEAKDMAAQPQSASLALSTLLDLGPSIEIFDPEDKKAYAVKTPVPIQFQVKSVPLAEDDPEAAVKAVQLRVSGVTIPLTETNPGLYQTTVNFNDKALFEVTPADADVLITVTNGRTPTAATRSLRRGILVDGAPPSIVVDHPVKNQIVHSNVELRLTITDAAGVDRSTVKAVVKSEGIEITNWKVSGNTYSATLNTGEFGPDIVQPTLTISATDIVKNERTITHTLYVDNQPPVLSLDPPNIREWTKVGAAEYCSAEFDPLGNAVSDKGEALDASLYRVLVEDRSSRAIGSNYSLYAGVNPDTVEIFAQKDPSIPILIDTNPDDDPDHYCDQINFDALPDDQRPTPLLLTPLTPRGSTWFPKPASVDFHTTTHNVTDGNYPSCVANPNGADLPPGTLCPETPMSRVIAGRGDDKPPAIYAFSPTNTSTGPCEGWTWQLLPILLDDNEQQGWRCLAARAVDRIGNVGVSEAIRACFTRTLGVPCAGPPPDCHTCKIAPWQKYDANRVWELR